MNLNSKTYGTNNSRLRGPIMLTTGPGWFSNVPLSTLIGALGTGRFGGGDSLLNATRGPEM